MSKTKRLMVKAIPFVVALSGVGNGCASQEEKHVQERGRYVRVRAPFTKVDVWIPEDDDEDPQVDVEVDD